MDDLWQRRPNSTKLSLATKEPGILNKEHGKMGSTRSYQSSKRAVGEIPLNNQSSSVTGMMPLTPTTVVSPTTGASSAFGLGSGAFASFGSSGKISRSSNTSLEYGDLASEPAKREKSLQKEASGKDVLQKEDVIAPVGKSYAASLEHALKNTWIVWYRPPAHKFSDYEKSTLPLASFSSVESFWALYAHLKRPSTLPSVSDYHIFRKGIRPVWEDDENKNGGKWILRLKKGVSDRYWEDLLLAIIGDQFAEAGEEVCGAVLSVRAGEDVLSIWTRIDGGRNIRIRETTKRILSLPHDTNMIWKSHDASIAQRSAIEEARKDQKGHHSSSKRRETNIEDTADRGKGVTAQ